MRIGVISDTHNFLDPAVSEIFAGVEHILHGGDVGLPSIVMALERIAPTTVVSGNTDHSGWFPESAFLELGYQRILLQHIVEPLAPGPETRRLIEKHVPRLLIFGHTHKPYDATHGTVRFLNPGYAGKQRFNLPRSVAILELLPGGPKFQFHPL